MARLTETELTHHRGWLSDWHSPADVAAYVSAVNHAMSPADFFSQGGVGFLRDAWLAAEFGRHRQSSAVRLVPEREQWPDFEARDGDVIERVECAEADLPDRRRGNEYRETERRNADGGPVIVDDPIEDWTARADQAQAALFAAVTTKIGKLYAGRVSLLIYLNIGEFGARQAEIEAAMASAVAPALPHFSRAWVLRNAQLYGPWTA
jgi:hypothetical protein